MSAIIYKLLPKQSDMINLKRGNTSLRNIVEIGFLLTKTRNTTVLIGKHDVKWTQIIVTHVGGRHGYDQLLFGQTQILFWF